MNVLGKARIKALRTRRTKLLREVCSLRLLIRGNYLERFSTCSRETCGCHKGRRHGPRNYVVVTDDKRQKQHYVPQAQVHVVLKGIAQYRHLLEVLASVTRINVELMRGGALDDSW